MGTSKALNESTNKENEQKMCLNQERYFLYARSSTLWSLTNNAPGNATQPRGLIGTDDILCPTEKKNRCCNPQCKC